jgi:hypothetical protein
MYAARHQKPRRRCQNTALQRLDHRVDHPRLQR